MRHPSPTERVRRIQRVLLAVLILAMNPLGRADNPPPSLSSAVASKTRPWAFEPVQIPKPPTVEDPTWVTTPIDAFILRALEIHHLKPAKPAEKPTLLRRLSLDLIGLPPTTAELEAFAADESPRAYEVAVERFLSSPHYGERWGRYWLDVARYADTKGYVFYYEESQFVQPYRYRDWVIDAFNADMPYDRFLLCQIAADQLVLNPSSNTSPRNNIQAATANPASTLGHPDIAALGFLTLGRRFLGNPHDIIDDQLDVLIRGTQGLTIGCARCHDHKFDPLSMADYYALYGVMQSSQERLMPLAEGPRADTRMTFAEARERIEFDRELNARVTKLETAFQSACGQVADRLRSRTTEYLIAAVDRDRLPTLSANVRPAPDDINPYNVRQWDLYLRKQAVPTHPVFFAWSLFSALKPEDFPLRSRQILESLRLEQTPASDGFSPNPLVAGLFDQTPQSMKEVATRYGELFTQVHAEWKSGLEAARTNKTPVPSQLPNAAREQIRRVLYDPDSPVLAPKGSMVELDVHLYFDDPNRVALSKLQMEIEQWVNNSPLAPPHTVALADRTEPVNGRIFPRGDPSRAAQEVPRRFLQALGGSDTQPFQTGSGRLELARAITSPDNPLTARVLVNRIWAQHFGTGLVPTQSDFGSRSDPPSHPELLDWLAHEFMANGWSIKQLHRWIVRSSTYRQSSVARQPNADSIDPANRWLHRYPRRRLDFEALRDSILTATGELDLHMGGKAFDLEADPAIPRRTVYGRIDRRFVPAVLRSFDFANPDLHSPQRFTTTIPQQALYFLNSPWLVQRARALAKRATSSSTAPGNFAHALTALYDFVHHRKPTSREEELARRFLEDSPASNGEGLSPLEQFAQVLLFSNELAHIE